MNIADVDAANKLQKSPMLGGVPSDDNRIVPKNARNALTQVEIEILRPSRR